MARLVPVDRAPCLVVPPYMLLEYIVRFHVGAVVRVLVRRLRCQMVLILLRETNTLPLRVLDLSVPAPRAAVARRLRFPLVYILRVGDAVLSKVVLII